jgi:hypothetical protein
MGHILQNGILVWFWDIQGVGTKITLRNIASVILNLHLGATYNVPGVSELSLERQSHLGTIPKSSLRLGLRRM